MIEDTRDFYIGFVSSFVGHALFFLLFSGFLFSGSKSHPNVIYSVTIEGGKALGGLSQAPTDQKSKETPYKKVEPQEKAIPKKEEKPEVVIPDKKKVEEEKKRAAEEEKKKEKQKESEKKKEKKGKDESIEDINKSIQQAVQRYKGESVEAGGKGFGAAKLGGQGMGGGVIRPPEFFAYRDLLKNRIKSGWRWYDSKANLDAIVTFDISRDGHISNVRLESRSGNLEYDDSVERAVIKASPVPAPPEIVYEFFSSVRMTFNPQEE